jgi:tetratricopeptide (TPR) repeat protein
VICRAKRREVRIGLLTAAAAGMGTGVLLACGPLFPNSLLRGTDEALLHMAAGRFHAELARIRLPWPPLPCKVARLRGDGIESTAEADAADLAAELDRQGARSGVKRERVSAVQAFRAVLGKYVRDVSDWRSSSQWAKLKAEKPRAPDLAVPRGLPPEFDLYLRGAVAYRDGNIGEARRQWEALLALPEDQRRNRSTWAAFMLGKTWLDDDPSIAVAWFERVRALAERGLADRLALAAESVGWQARAELNRGNCLKALEGYLRQYQIGEPTSLQSIRLVIARVFQSRPEILGPLAADPVLQRVVTAYMVSDDCALWQDRWLEALEKIRANPVADADRLAWIAYRAGALQTAERWLARAPAESPVAQWIRAKLLLREGKTDQAAGILARLVRAFPEDAAWAEIREDLQPEHYFPPCDKPLGELGMLRLARLQYAEALDCLLRAGYWMDAAYVAERVLTPEELIAYVDGHWASPPARLPPPQEESWYDGNDHVSTERVPERIRYLLARRLARKGRYEQARPYYPPQWQPVLTDFARQVRIGTDRKQKRGARAEALWEAAKIARYRGMALLGTETDPDWFLFGGAYALDPCTELRLRPNVASGGWRYNRDIDPRADLRRKPDGSAVAPASEDEKQRAARHAAETANPRRFHYRYLAAEWAWQAAALMPDQSPRTAEVLWQSGLWLAGRYPGEADRFYKALVRRCGKTALGSEADRLRWFPRSRRPEGQGKGSVE